MTMGAGMFTSHRCWWPVNRSSWSPLIIDWACLVRLGNLASCNRVINAVVVSERYIYDCCSNKPHLGITLLSRSYAVNRPIYLIFVYLII